MPSSYRNPELILGLAKGLRPLEKQELLPETRLLLALLPRVAHEATSLARRCRQRSSSGNCSPPSPSVSQPITIT